MLNINEFITAVDVNHSEVYLEIDGKDYIVSESMGHGPTGEPLSLTGPDGQMFAWNANGILDLTLDGKPIRSFIDCIDWT